MANLASYTIPNLIQGISQQPDGQRDPSQGEAQVNGMSSLAEGLRKREGTSAVARVSTAAFGDVYFHQILRDAGEKYLVVIGKTSIKVFDLQGVQKTVSAPYGYGYLSSVVTAKGDIRCATIADYTFVLNTKATPAMKSAVAPKVARPAANEALIWVKAANYGQRYIANVNGIQATVETAVAPVITSGTTVTENRISSADIAGQIRSTLLSAGLSGVSIARTGSVLHLTSSSAITIQVSDARANSDISAITSSVQSFTELPAIAPEGYQVTIVGDPGNKFDNYHVSFVPRGSASFGEGTWSETVAAGVQYALDETKMPHVLVRLPSGSFYFGPLDGSTQGGVKLPKWGERKAGNYDTAPDPSFIGYPIQDVFIYKNRLGFLADENVILSRPREFFDFFPETVTTVLDSDPIDLTASNNRVSILRYAVPYQDELIIFSDQIQFRFSSSDAILSPSTATITVLTQYEVDPDCRPIPVAGAIIFCQSNGAWSQFREFSVRGAGTALVADAGDLTSYVSSYIPSDVFKLAGNDTGNVWFALSEKQGYQDRLYVYKYFYRNGGDGTERAQSSWSHWTLTGADKILSFLCVQEVLYLLVQYGAEVWLEKLPVADRLSDPSPSPYPLLLDRRVSTTTETPAAIRVAPGVYNAITRQTTWTLPYQAAALTQAWSGYSATGDGGVLLGSTSSGSQITAPGNWSSQPVYFGEAYDFFYRFTRFKLYREVGGGKAAASVGRTQVRHAKLRYHETRYFRVLVAAERRDPVAYVYDGVTLGVRNSQIGSQLGQGLDVEDRRYAEGVFHVPILSKGDTCIVEIHNDTAHPCKFSTCEWVGLITTPARSLQ